MSSGYSLVLAAIAILLDKLEELKDALTESDLENTDKPTHSLVDANITLIEKCSNIMKDYLSRQ